jgi:Protein of unknown function (DUF732)
MRDRETIDSELRRLAAVHRSVREHGGRLSTGQIDQLLDERLGHPPEAPETNARQTEVVNDTWSQFGKTDDSTPHGPKGVLRRFGRLAALPLSLVAAAAALVVMFAFHNPHPAAEPTEIPPSAARPDPAEPTVVPPSRARPNLAAPQPSAPPLDIVDRAFIDVLKRDGVPVPSHEYVTTQAHAVCDFLAHQPNFAEAVSFVQRSSIWDASQSSSVAAGAVVSYCPQYEISGADETQHAFENALSDLQAIQGDLQGIRDDLPAIPGQH